MAQPEGSGPARRPLREELRREALAHGFDRADFAAAGPPPHAERFREWLARGYAGSMEYLARNAEKRLDPARVLPGARTVIALAIHYGQPGEEERSARSGEEAAALAAAGRAEISRYARGTDYHRVVEARLKTLCAALARLHPGAGFRWYVDTGPVLERAWAEAAGLGWIGKNACAIDPRRGSYFFIAVVLTTLDIPPDEPAADHCGSCRLCIDACPTAAIVEPYRIDARRCISYLTIEHRGEVPTALKPAAGGLVFGCDICQEVCPYNKPDRLQADPELASRPENLQPALEEILGLDREGFASRFPRSAVRRARASGLLRNAILAVGAGGRKEELAALERLAVREDVAGDPALADALAWASERLGKSAG